MCPGGGELGRISLSPPPRPAGTPGCRCPGHGREPAPPSCSPRDHPAQAATVGTGGGTSPNLLPAPPHPPAGPRQRGCPGEPQPRGRPAPPEDARGQKLPTPRPPPPPPRRLRQPRPLTKPRRSAASRPPREYRLPGSRRGNPHGPRHHGNPGPGSHRYSLTSFP